MAALAWTSFKKASRVVEAATAPYLLSWQKKRLEFRKWKAISFHAQKSFREMSRFICVDGITVEAPSGDVYYTSDSITPPLYRMIRPMWTFWKHLKHSSMAWSIQMMSEDSFCAVLLPAWYCSCHTHGYQNSRRLRSKLPHAFHQQILLPQILFTRKGMEASAYHNPMGIPVYLPSKWQFHGKE